MWWCMLLPLLVIVSKAMNITVLVVDRYKIVDVDPDTTVAELARVLDSCCDPRHYAIQCDGRTLSQAATLKDQGVRAEAEMAAVWAEDLSEISDIIERLTDYAQDRLLRKLRKMKGTDHCVVYVGNTPWGAIKKQYFPGEIRYRDISQSAGLVRKDRVELRLLADDVMPLCTANYTQNES